MSLSERLGGRLSIFVFINLVTKFFPNSKYYLVNVNINIDELQNFTRGAKKIEYGNQTYWLKQNSWCGEYKVYTFFMDFRL